MQTIFCLRGEILIDTPPLPRKAAGLCRTLTDQNTTMAFLTLNRSAPGLFRIAAGALWRLFPFQRCHSWYLIQASRETTSPNATPWAVVQVRRDPRTSSDLTTPMTTPMTTQGGDTGSTPYTHRYSSQDSARVKSSLPLSLSLSVPLRALSIYVGQAMIYRIIFVIMRVIVL